ncbi:hypothetical protein E2C01_087754 [Portunus trituberculatus]|uniref:Uncharacterized protein n=1 Tax=Portunus trituberculatus TaxID=210409 RepID=A0A5B7J905_PORTR|nr:hypothetical protein [Portunus trituberculatus]
MAGVNKPTTLREDVKEEALPNYLSVAAPPLVTAVTSGAPSTPGDRELTLDELSAHELTEVSLRVWSMLPRNLTRTIATADRVQPHHQHGRDQLRWRRSKLPMLLTVR